MIVLQGDQNCCTLQLYWNLEEEIHLLWASLDSYIPASYIAMLTFFPRRPSQISTDPSSSGWIWLRHKLLPFATTLFTILEADQRPGKTQAGRVVGCLGLESTDYSFNRDGSWKGMKSEGCIFTSLQVNTNTTLQYYAVPIVYKYIILAFNILHQSLV